MVEIENTDYYQVYKNLATTYSKERTDRISDLNRLLEIHSSFCIFSEKRNGITTLIRDFATKVNGIYIDAMGLSPRLEIKELEQLIGSENNPVLLDEVRSFFSMRGGYEQAIYYLQKLSKKRQLGLRLHPNSEQYKDDLRQRGFEIVEIGRIPYEEFKAIFDSQFESVGFSLPERFIQHAHTTYPALAKSILYIAEAFRLLVENPTKELSDAEICNVLKQRCMLFSL